MCNMVKDMKCKVIDELIFFMVVKCVKVDELVEFEKKFFKVLVIFFLEKVFLLFVFCVFVCFGVVYML